MVFTDSDLAVKPVLTGIILYLLPITNTSYSKEAASFRMIRLLKRIKLAIQFYFAFLKRSETASQLTTFQNAAI
jgi:hypothetical protein